MSNTFQVGDTVRVLPNEAAPHQGLHPNTERTVEHADETHVRVSDSPYEWHARRFELVKRATPAPSLPTQDGDDDGREAAPLDPSNVKPGDTATLFVAPAGHAPTYTVIGEAYLTAGNGVYVGGWPVMDSRVTLADHQPAPEPEREPGTSGTATVEGKAGVQGTWVRSLNGEDYFATHHAETSTGNLAHSDQVTDFVPDEPRLLPTRDDLARVMHDDYLPNGPRLGRTAREHLADAVLAFLRGEVR